MRHKRDKMITIRVNESFQREVQAAADAENRTVTSYIINACEERMNPRLIPDITDGWVYFLHATVTESVKIGWTANDIDVRLKACQTGSPVPLTVLGQVRARPKIEKALHRRFAHLRIRGEWFQATRELLTFIEDLKRDPVTTLARHIPDSLKNKSQRREGL